jgi:hypothetical protein
MLVVDQFQKGYRPLQDELEGRSSRGMHLVHQGMSLELVSVEPFDRVHIRR